MAKQIYKKLFFSAMTKNLNWEISTQNLITFKRWDGINEKKLILWEFTEKFDFLGGGSMIIFFLGEGAGVNRLKSRDLDSLQI